MPKTPRPGPGDVVEQVTQTRVIPAAAAATDDDDAELNPSDGKPRNVFDYMASLTPVEVDAHLIYIYREYPPGESGYIDCMKPPIDEAYLKKEFGGGTYNVLVKKGSEIKRGQRLKIVGTPLTPGSSSNGHGSSDLVQTVRMILEKERGGGNPNMEIMLVGVKNAMEMMRAATPPPMTMEQMTNALANLEKLRGGGSSDMPDWAKQAIAAVIPMGVALLQKMLTPQDSIAALKSVSEVMSMVKGISGGTEKSSFLTELGRNAPMLLSEGSKFLAELRAGAQLQQQNTALARVQPGETVAVMPAVHPQPARPAPAAMPAAPPTQVIDQSAIEAGRPSPEWVFSQVVKMCQDGQPGGAAFDFLDQIDPEFTRMLRGVTIEQLRLAIQNDSINPLLKQMLAFPTFDKFLGEFFAAVRESAEAEAKPPLPN